MSNVKIKIAKNKDGDITLIDDATNIEEYYCFDCNTLLIPKKGKIKNHHFSHKSNLQCRGETSEHLYGKELISKNKTFLPSNCFAYSMVE